MPREESGDEQDAGRTRSELSGQAGDVVQARDVSGGVHFHATAARSGPVPRQLPGDVRGFVDRGADLHRLDLILAENDSNASMICVVAGTAGVGKTSLVVHWAHRVAEEFPGGQLYVNLRGYDAGRPVGPEQALEGFLRALDVVPGAIPAGLAERAALYRSLMAGRRMLVVLDNAATVAQVRLLLPGTAGCLVLVTSRSRLSGLVARDGAHRLTVDMLPAEDAVDLLRAVIAGYRSQDGDADLGELARLCARLPLALRIAAERAASRPRMPLSTLIADLRDESALWEALDAGDDEADAVRTVFAWSYRALTGAARRLFRLLGLHPGPEFGAPAAAALADLPAAETRRLLDDLVGAHLLEQPNGDRFQFHDLLRAYAAETARDEQDAAECQAAVRRVLRWYLDNAAAAIDVLFPGTPRVPLADPQPAVVTGAEQAIRWFEAERANLVAAVHAAEQARAYDLGWQLPATLWRMYANTNRFDDWLSTGTVGLDSARRLGERPGEARLLESLAMAHTQAGDLEQGVSFHRAALAVRHSIGDVPGVASSTNGIGLVRLREHRLREALAGFREVERIATEQIDDPLWRVKARNNIANVRCALGEYRVAAEMLREVLASYRESGDRGSQGDALHGLSRALRGLGDLPAARESIVDALAIAHERENRAWEGYWLIELGHVQVALGEPAEALESCHRAATLQRRLGDRGREALALDVTGEAYRALGRPREAAEFHRQAAATFRAVGDEWHRVVALHALALALADAGAGQDAADCRAEALAGLAAFDDPAAERLRAALGGSGLTA